jgi:ribosomal protein L11 methyltransferase
VGGCTLLFPLQPSLKLRLAGKTAGVAQLVEHHLAKVDVASSSLVTRSSVPVYLWLKFSETRWAELHEDALQERAHGLLVIVSRPERRRLQLEIVCSSRRKSETLLKEFGGRVEKLPGNCLQHFTVHDSKPINAGSRLVILRDDHFSKLKLLRGGKTPLLIPSAAAFGTGEHVTTAMSLRLLEKLTRRWRGGWTLVDLGTGSGILALAAKCFGAGHVVGIDNDPTAILQAKSNARLNKIRGATFHLADARKWNWPQATDVITANLYSDLLVGVLPDLNHSGWLILSGILHREKNEFLRALRANRVEVVSIKHRGKWIAILAHLQRFAWRQNLRAAKFCDADRPPLH